jgi:hypothetical protein
MVAQQTKNAMVILDPKSWTPIQIYKMREKDGLPRASVPHVGYEDMRLFRTDKGGLQGIAASLHLRRVSGTAASAGMPQHQPPEQVVVSFDDEYNIVEAQPIRGDGWSGKPQKNWVPFDHCTEPRFLFSISTGRMFDDRGALHGEEARVLPSASSSVAITQVAPIEPLLIAPVSSAPSPPPASIAPEESIRGPKRKLPMVRGGDVVVRGGRVKLDTVASRPSSRPAVRSVHRTDDSTRILGSGRSFRTYEGLRGGTQLVRVADDAWLGIGHEMKFVNSKKLYWHTWYLVDATGTMTLASEPMKLAQNGIEFAAGMVVDGERVVVSFGVDDMHSMLGETQLSAVMESLRLVK